MKRRAASASVRLGPEHPVQYDDDVHDRHGQTTKFRNHSQLDEGLSISEAPDSDASNTRGEIDYQDSDSAFNPDESEMTLFAEMAGEDELEATLRNEIARMYEEETDKDDRLSDVQILGESPSPKIHSGSASRIVKEERIRLGYPGLDSTDLEDQAGKNAAPSRVIVVAEDHSTNHANKDASRHTEMDPASLVDISIANEPLPRHTVKRSRAAVPMPEESDEIHERECQRRKIRHTSSVIDAEPEGISLAERNDSVDFSGLNMVQLQDQPFEPVVSHSPSAVLHISTNDTLCESLERISQIKHPESRTSQQQELFSSLSLGDSSKCAGLITTKLTHLITELDRIRQEKRKLTIRFQEEIAAQEGVSRAHEDAVSTKLARLKQSGENVLQV